MKLDNDIPVMILCGGKGTRLKDVSEILPKPLVKIGDYPIVQHIMRRYATYGCKRFILCLGYKHEEFIKYFVNFKLLHNDITLTMTDDVYPNIKVHNNENFSNDWEITLAYTGLESQTGTRIQIASKYLKPSDNDFFVTYGDGLSNIDIDELFSFHKKTNKMLTISAVHPPERFGEIMISDKNDIISFSEKPKYTKSYINGGYMVMTKKFLSYYLNSASQMVLEKEPINNAIANKNVSLYMHNGFWQCMDNQKEYELLNQMWNDKNIPWMK